MRLTLDQPPFVSRSGRGVRVAVIDSGIALQHPHVGPVVSGICLCCPGNGEALADYRDRHGHGTAVAAAIRDKAENAALIAVRVFDRTLSTSANTLAQAIRWSADNGVQLINLSLGTPNAARGELLNEVVSYAAGRGALVVAAAEHEGRPIFPGSLPNVVGVVLEPSCFRTELVVRQEAELLRLGASGLPRPIPGVPPDRNLYGISFAVANATGFLARLVEGAGEGDGDGNASACALSLRDLKELLRATP